MFNNTFSLLLQIYIYIYDYMSKNCKHRSSVNRQIVRIFYCRNYLLPPLCAIFSMIIIIVVSRQMYLNYPPRDMMKQLPWYDCAYRTLNIEWMNESSSFVLRLLYAFIIELFRLHQSINLSFDCASSISCEQFLKWFRVKSGMFCGFHDLLFSQHFMFFS